MGGSELARRVHEAAAAPGPHAVTVRGDYEYWHYLCDRQDSSRQVPSIREIQQALADIEDKPQKFVGSRDWIGSVEVALVLDTLCDVPGKILHVQEGRQLHTVLPAVRSHLEATGCPIMMGGHVDASSKGVFGVCSADGTDYMLIVDPHFVGKQAEPAQLATDGWVSWVDLRQLEQTSFYNLCLPQVKNTQL